jgi:hypothetical protein
MGTTHGLADALGIIGIVFLVLHVWPDKLRAHQLDGMSLLRQLARPMMGPPGGFEPNEARGQLGEERQHFGSREALTQHHVSFG